MICDYLFFSYDSFYKFMYRCYKQDSIELPCSWKFYVCAVDGQALWHTTLLNAPCTDRGTSQLEIGFVILTIGATLFEKFVEILKILKPPDVTDLPKISTIVDIEFLIVHQACWHAFNLFLILNVLLLYSWQLLTIVKVVKKCQSTLLLTYGTIHVPVQLKKNQTSARKKAIIIKI